MTTTESSYKSYTKQYIKAEMKEIENALMLKLEKAFESGAIPEDWSRTGNHLLKKAIIDSFCKDRPYQMSSVSQKEADNLHLFI